jgi:formate dehydrogenase subunit gamma
LKAVANNNDKLLRHAAIDRTFHWVMAATMVALLITGLLPVAGIKLAWYEIHWICGLLLTLVIVLHIVRALFWQRPRSMVPGGADLRAGGAGKYTLPQKLMHLGWTVAVVVAIVTGLLLLSKAGVPFLERNPYSQSLQAWGLLTLLHDLAALLALFLVMVHIYFAILPEKRAYLRAMISGWVSRRDLSGDHDIAKVERGE